MSMVFRADPVPPTASDTVSGLIEIAIQSEMETGTDTVRAVVPGRQHFHASALKAWEQFNAAGTIAASYNMTSNTDNSAGNWSPVIATDMSSANYWQQAGGPSSTGTIKALVYNTTNNVSGGGSQIFCRESNADNSFVDPTLLDAIYWAAAGDI